MNAEARFGLVLLCWALSGCGEGKGAPSIAKALETKSEMEVAAAAVAQKKHDDAIAAGAVKDAELGEARSKCLLRKSIEVAACTSTALGSPLPTLKDAPRLDVARRIVEACMAAHGKDA